MALAGRILQSNLNHSARAQDLLVQTMAEWNIELAILAEPYRVPDSTDWIGDLGARVAIVRGGTWFSPGSRTGAQRWSRGRGMGGGGAW